MSFVLLPRTYHLVYFPLVVFLGFILFGVAVFRMGDYYEQMGRVVGPRPGLAAAIPSMVVLGLVIVVFAAGVPVAFNALAGKVGGGMPGKAIGMVGQLLGFGAQAFLIYSLVSLRRGSAGPLRAVRDGIATGRRRFWPTMWVVVTVFLVHWPINALLAHPDKVVLKFSPELVFYLMMAGVVLELITNYFIFSATTALAISRREGGLG
jgi:hypothetical protein